MQLLYALHNYLYIYIIYVCAANYSKLNLPVAVALYAALTDPALCALAALAANWARLMGQLTC